jgi:subtilase family serine protease
MQFSNAALAAAAAALLATANLATPVRADSGPSRMITAAINERALLTLAGNTRPEARNPDYDRGPVADSFPMPNLLLELQRSPQQEAALEEFMQEQAEPASPNYRHWLTAQEFGARYGASAADIATLKAWLQGQGFKVDGVTAGGMTIVFSGNAGAIRSAFHTEIHQLSVNGVAHYANISDPQIPAALAPVVRGVVSMHNFRPHPDYRPRAAALGPEYTDKSAGTYALVPADLATIYNLNPLFSAGYSGQGQTIAVLEDTNQGESADWTTFRNEFGLSAGYPDGSLSVVHPSGSETCTNPGVVSGDEDEASLDIEWASAAAPSATIELASCTDTANFGGYTALDNLVNGSSPPQIVSLSYGDCEPDNGAAANAAFSTLYQQAASEGVSVFVSTGDTAAASCDANFSTEDVAIHGINVSGYASTPYNVAVGGTDFYDTALGTTASYWSSTNGVTFGSAETYIPEMPWNDSCASSVLAKYENISTTYGSSGVCNNSNFDTAATALNFAGGSGGPSGCYSGSPTINDVVSGSCAGQAKPSWQSVYGNPADGVRDLPDLSMFAGNGVWGHFYVYCDSDTADSGQGNKVCSGAPSGWSGAGGTSFATPVMAGIQALVNQYAGLTKGAGNPAPIYYKLADTEYGSGGSASCNSAATAGPASTCVFYDVTVGDTDVPCKADSSASYDCYLPSGSFGVLSTSSSAFSDAYATTSGWDFATGIGTVNAYNLAVAWVGTVPSSPVGFTAAPGNALVTLNWQATTGASSYNIYQGAAPGAESTTPVQTGVTGTSVIISGLSNGTTYYFKIAAVNGAGTSKLSSEASAAPVLPVPTAPSSLTATAGNGQVSLSWQGSTGASSYNVYQGTTAGGESSTPVQTDVVGTSVIITGLSNGTTYYFKVAGVNTAGTGAFSNEASATPVPPAPAAPTGVSASAGNAQVTLSWQASSGATSYNVYWGGASGAEGAVPAMRMSGITTTSAMIAGLNNGITYYFQVRAVNAGGTSAASSEVSATPAAGGGGGAFPPQLLGVLLAALLWRGRGRKP